jgi:ABC-type amino acid transport substrate-binding protein
LERSRAVGASRVRIAGPILEPEAHGIAFPSGGALRERVNQALLAVREDGTYARLFDNYFG